VSNAFHVSRNREDLLPVTVGELEAEKDASFEVAGDDEAVAPDEEEGVAPETPPAAAESCAKPMEGGSERNTV
jgi:hypothetical protein